MPIYFPGVAAKGPPQPINTGPGPRQMLGLPAGPKGAGPSPQPAVPLTLYQQQGNTGFPKPNQQGQAILPKPLKPYNPVMTSAGNIVSG